MKKVLSLVLFVFASLLVRADFVPVTIASGFNKDVIANGVSATPTSTIDVGVAGFDNVNYTWVAQDYNYNGNTPAFYLPNGGLLNSTITAGLSWQLADYSSENCLFLNATTAGNNGTLAFSSALSASTIYVLGSVGSGGTLFATTVTVTITFTDATTQVQNTTAFGDWYNGGAPCTAGFGRIHTTDGIPEGNATQPRMYQAAININAANLTKQIQSVKITTVSSPFNTNARVGVFGVSIREGVLTTSVSSLPDFGSVPACSSSSSQTFNISGSDLFAAGGSITANAPAGFEISNDNSTWGSTATFTYAGNTMTNVPVYVRFSPTIGGPASGNVTFSGGTVNNLPTVAVSGTGTGLSLTPTTTAAFGNIIVTDVSPSQIYMLSGSGLDGSDVVITTNNPDFQVSPDGITWYNSYDIPNGGTFGPTAVYVWFTPTALGPESAVISITGGGSVCTLNFNATGTGVLACASAAAPTGISFPSTNSSGTGIGFTPTGTTDGYVVIQSTSPFVGNAVDNTTYNVGDAIGNGIIVSSSYAAPPLTITSGTAPANIDPNTFYYITVYAFNGGAGGTCGGGPLYSPTTLDGTYTTCPATPASINTTPAVTSLTINWASSSGGGASTVTYNLEVATDAGFTAPVAGSPFTVPDVPGGTVSYMVTGLNAATTFFYRITANGACSSVPATGSAATTNYCSPSFVNGCGSWHNESIVVDAINWTVGACATSDYTSMVANINAGVAEPMTVVSGNFTGCSVWVDFNGDGDFDDLGENLFFQYQAPGTATYNISLLVPGSVPTGNYRMRVLATWGSDGVTPGGNGSGGACAPDYQYGNFDDFTLHVINGPTLTTSVTTLPTFGNVALCTSSSAQTFTLSGFTLTPAADNIIANAPAGFDISSDGVTWNSTATFPYTGGALAATTVYVRATPTATGLETGNVTFSGGGVTTPPTVALTATGVNPSVAVGANPFICPGATTASLPYSSPVGTPTTYTLTWDAAALGQGFTNVTGGVLPASPITIAVPGGAPVAVYNATLTVANAGGCTSTGVPVTVTIGSPSITLGTSVPVCLGAASTTVSYSAPTNSPTNYNIVWDATAAAAGFADVTNVALPVSPITLVIPGTATATTYNGTLTVTNAQGCVSAGIPVSVTINQLPDIAVDPNPGVCIGATSGSLTYTSTTNAPTTYSLAWSAAAIGAGFANVTNSALPASPIPLTLPAGAAAGPYTTTLTVSNGGCISAGIPVTLTVNALPTATISGTTAICSGTSGVLTFAGTPDATVSFTINGTGAQLTLDAAGNATLNTSALTATTVYDITNVLDNNTTCTQAITGQTATITVNALPTVVISGATTFCAGGNGDITFTGTPGAIVSYTINGAAAPDVTLDLTTGIFIVNTGAIVATAIYDVTNIVDNSTTCSQAITTQSATVTVNPLPTATISGTTSICSGGNTDITITGTPGADVDYTIDGVAQTAITLNAGGSATVNTGTLTAAVTTTTVYSITNVTDGVTGCAQAITGQDATVTINPLPTVTISSNTSLCSGSNTDVIFTGTPGAIVTYTIDGGAPLTVAITTAGTATVNTGAISANTVYTVVSVQDGATLCSQNITGQSETITIVALPTASISGPSSVCDGSSTSITFTGTPGAIVTYTINGGAPLTTTLDGSGSSILNTGALSAATVYDLVSVALTGTPSCPQTLTGSVSIAINPLPTVTISGTTTICSGSNTDITFTGTPGANVDYTLNGNPLSVTIGTSGTVTVNTGTITGTAIYVVTDVTDGLTLCSQVVTGQTATVSVNPLPTATISADIAICSGTGTTITFTGTPGALVSYTVDGIPAADVTLGTGGTTTVNTGNLTATTVYDITLVTDGATFCAQAITGQTETVTVNPLPTITISGTATICSGQNTIITFTGTPGAVVSYTANGIPAVPDVTLDGSGNGSANTGILTGNGVYDITLVTDGVTGCSQPVTGQTVTVTVNPLPTATISGTASICNGTNATITFAGTPQAIVTYTVDGGAQQTIALDATGAASVTFVVTATTTYDLVLATSALGCPQTVSGSATITAISLPTASISGTTTICNTVTTVITFTGTPNAVINYTANGGGGTTTLDASGNSLVNVTPSVTTTYDLVDVTGTGGCVAPATGSAIVTVNQLPSATITGTTAICFGNSTTITITGTPNATVVYNDGTGPQTITLDAAGNYTTTVAPVVTTTYALTGATSIEGCSQSLTGIVTVTVNPLPTANIDGDATICLGSGDFAVLLFTGTPNSTVTYTTNGGGTSTITLNALGYFSLNVTPTVTSDYALVSATSAAGCLQTAVGDATVTVNPMPTATISGDVTICGNSTALVPITFTGTPGATVTYIIDNNPDQTIALDATGNAEVDALPGVNTTYYIQSVSAPNGCAQNLTGSATITVLPAVTATISGTTEICSGSSSTIAITGTPNSNVVYTVNGGPQQSILLDATGSAGLIVTPSVNTIYALVSVTSPGGCTQILTSIASVQVDDYPTVNISGTTSICSGNNAQIVFNGTPGAVVTYNVNGGANQTITLDATGSASVVVSPAGNITYTLVSISTIAGCSQPVSGSATVSVDAAPQVVIFGTTTVSAGENATIEFVGSANTVVTYTVNGIPATITLSPTGVATLIVTPTATTTYALLSAVGSNGCTELLTGSAIVTIGTLGVVNVNGNTNLEVSIHPNPASDHTTITYNSDVRGDTKLRVSNISGQQVFAKDLGEQHSGQIDVPMQDMPAGIYIVELQSGDRIVTKRLVKQ